MREHWTSAAEPCSLNQCSHLQTYSPAQEIEYRIMWLEIIKQIFQICTMTFKKQASVGKQLELSVEDFFLTTRSVEQWMTAT